MVSGKPRLSVLLPAFNAQKYVAQAVESILAQTYSDFELIIADDGSTDNTRHLIDGYRDTRITCIHSDVNRGKIYTVNDLISICRGEYVTVHDADDYSAYQRFEKQMNFLERNSDHVMVGTSFYEVNKKKRKAVIMPSEYSEIRRNLPFKSQFHGPTLMFQKKILGDVGGLYRYFTWGEDIDFTARVVEKYTATNLKEPLYYYRIHPESLTKDVNKLRPERMVNAQLRLFLARQRMASGVDCLMQNRPEELEEEKQRLLAPFQNDPDLVYWKFSQEMHYYGFNKEAVWTAWKAFCTKRSFKNLKNVAHKLLSSAVNRG